MKRNHKQAIEKVQIRDVGIRTKTIIAKSLSSLIYCFNCGY